MLEFFSKKGKGNFYEVGHCSIRLKISLIIYGSESPYTKKKLRT